MTSSRCVVNALAGYAGFCTGIILEFVIRRSVRSWYGLEPCVAEPSSLRYKMNEKFEQWTGNRFATHPKRGRTLGMDETNPKK